jgi:hypothetical protein
MYLHAVADPALALESIRTAARPHRHPYYAVTEDAEKLLFILCLHWAGFKTALGCRGERWFDTRWAIGYGF